MNKVALLVGDEALSRRLQKWLGAMDCQVTRFSDFYLASLYIQLVPTQVFIMDVEEGQLQDLVRMDYFRRWRKGMKSLFLLPRSCYFAGEDENTLRMDKPVDERQFSRIMGRHLRPRGPQWRSLTTAGWVER